MDLINTSFFLTKIVKQNPINKTILGENKMSWEATHMGRLHFWSISSIDINIPQSS